MARCFLKIPTGLQALLDYPVNPAIRLPSSFLSNFRAPPLKDCLITG